MNVAVQAIVQKCFIAQNFSKVQKLRKRNPFDPFNL